MMYVVLSWRNIWRNKRRTFITMASVFFAIILAIVMRSATSGVYENMIHNLVSFSSGYIQVHLKGYWEDQSLENTFHDDSSVEMKIRESGLTTIVPRLETFALISSGEQTRGVAVVGIIPEKEKEITGLDRKLISGIYPDVNDNGILIGKGLAGLLKIELNDTLILIGQGYHANSAAALLPVTGIVSLGSPQLDEGMVYIPLLRCREIFSADSLLTSLSVMIPSAEQLSQYHNRIVSNLDTSKYEVMTWKQMMPELDQFIQADSSGHYIVIFILYLVISFGLFGTILMMTKERMHEFGILIAIGMKKRILSMIVIIEILLISLCGAITGIMASFPVVWYFRYNPIKFTGQLEEAYRRYGFEPVMVFSNELHIFYMQAFIVFLLALVLALYPFFKIMRLKPIEAINS